MVPGLTEAEARRVLLQRAWISENLRSVGTKLSVQDYERFCAYCESCGMSRYAVIRELLLDALDAAERVP